MTVCRFFLSLYFSIAYDSTKMYDGNLSWASGRVCVHEPHNICGAASATLCTVTDRRVDTRSATAVYVCLKQLLIHCMQQLSMGEAPRLT